MLLDVIGHGSLEDSGSEKKVLPRVNSSSIEVDGIGWLRRRRNPHSLHAFVMSLANKSWESGLAIWEISMIGKDIVEAYSRWASSKAGGGCK